jgi:hypothetical protein
MFSPRRVIPKLAVAALALTGCGETASPDGFFGTGGTPGTGGSGGNSCDDEFAAAGAACS